MTTQKANCIPRAFSTTNSTKPAEPLLQTAKTIPPSQSMYGQNPKTQETCKQTTSELNGEKSLSLACDLKAAGHHFLAMITRTARAF